MKCISKFRTIISCLVLSLILGGCSGSGLSNPYDRLDTSLNIGNVSGSSRLEGLAADLCVTDTDILPDNISLSSVEAAGLFNLEEKEVIYASNIHEKLYPASTTKILTALTALKYGNLEDEVTLSDGVTGFAWDEVTCGFKPGDKVKLIDLLNGLLIYSGNDAAAAIAEHISGSVSSFAEQMNEEAQALGATNSHFMNPHGLHDENHYTNVYDLYLIFQEAIKNEEFKKIIHTKSYTSEYTDAGGEAQTLTWDSTNMYLNEEIETPESVTVIGGKTGTTQAAGSCLVLLSENSSSSPFISIVLKAENRVLLYENMTKLIQGIN